jgi:hypothetical protein
MGFAVDTRRKKRALPVITASPARTETHAALVIFLSLAVFDRVSSRRTCRERRT